MQHMTIAQLYQLISVFIFGWLVFCFFSSKVCFDYCVVFTNNSKWWAAAGLTCSIHMYFKCTV